MSSELSGENVEDALADPAAFREGREREVVRVDLPQVWKEGSQIDDVKGSML
jgi:hypothetical protein